MTWETDFPELVEGLENKIKESLLKQIPVAQAQESERLRFRTMRGKIVSNYEPDPCEPEPFW